VVGPASATDNAFARFDLTTGKLIQNSSATLNDTGAPTFVGSVAVSGTSSSGADVKLYEDTDNGSNYVALMAPASIASNVSWTLPSADGTNGQALVTNGTGTLSWAAPSGGGQFEGSAANKAIFWNAQSIAENITITGTHNAGSIGPITIDSGFTVTIDSGARWVVI
jgi:hypothetical protein